MRLYGVRTSPYVRHARIALAESGLDWQFEQVTLDTINMSPTLRVPFLIDDQMTLSDSSVIVRYVREQAGQPYLATITDHELFALSTSVLDTAVNLYLLNFGDTADLAEMSVGTSAIGYNPKTYVERQYQRIMTGVDSLEGYKLHTGHTYTDGEIRLGCLLDWAVYRDTIRLEKRENLGRFLSHIRTWPPFLETSPDK